MPCNDERPDLTDIGRPIRAAAVRSFCGGAGGSSIVGTTLSPNGPRGPRESSSASSVVDWVPNRRVVREFRFVGDLVVLVGVGA